MASFNHKARRACTLLSLVWLFTVAGCASGYIASPAPNPVLANAALVSAPTDNEAGPFQILYVTNLKPAEDGSGYVEGRSNSMAMGSAHISPSNQSSSDYLNYMLGHPMADGPPEYILTDTDEKVRFPATPLPFAISGGSVVYDPVPLASYSRASASLKSTLARSLEHAGTDHVILYIPGFNNSFETSAFNLLELWTASDRTGVPMVFSWPTELSSPLNYFADTQDGAFAVFHLKETIRLIAATDAVASVSVVAHSHGASIATTALRELLIEERGAGRSLADTYDIDTLILAAPDIDLGVMEQRLVTEAFGAGFGQINVYINPDDDALGIAQLVFRNQRFGASLLSDFSPETRAALSGLSSVHFIAVEDAKGPARHNYFRLHPGVLADIGITLRTGAKPTDEARPLKQQDENFWTLDSSYQPRLK
jgi:esterase/lipase superfamily enzyme